MQCSEQSSHIQIYMGIGVILCRLDNYGIDFRLQLPSALTSAMIYTIITHHNHQPSFCAFEEPAAGAPHPW